MDRGHELLQAVKKNEVHHVLSGLSVTQYLGEFWVRRHPGVKDFILQFEKELGASGNV